MIRAKWWNVPDNCSTKQETHFLSFRFSWICSCLLRAFIGKLYDLCNEKFQSLAFGNILHWLLTILTSQIKLQPLFINQANYSLIKYEYLNNGRRNHNTPIVVQIMSTTLNKQSLIIGIQNNNNRSTFKLNTSSQIALLKNQNFFIGRHSRIVSFLVASNVLII